MRTLIEKEIRLLLPAFVAAVVLAIVPIWFLSASNYLDGQESTRASYTFLIGIALLGLSTFGREIGLKTLPFTLAQPLERGRIWWTKVAVLVLFTALAFAAWWVSEILCGYNHRITPRYFPAQSFLSIAVWLNTALLAAVLTAGGLWMTLLLRQVSAALWPTLLIPVAATIAIQAMGGPDWLISMVLGLYAVAGVFLAKRQFFHIQDTAWTGGVVSLGRARAATEKGGLRENRPWAALIRKELQLHQFTLAGIAALLVLHLGVVVVRKFGAHDLGWTTLSALEMFGGVWLIVPLMAGCQSVAEERQLGTLDGLLCLSVSRKAQFAVKLIFVIVLGGFLSAALLCGVEEFAQSIGAGADLSVMKISFVGLGAVLIFLVFVVLALLGFYASTLTRSVVQALAAGLVTAGVFWFVDTMATRGNDATDAFGWKLWPAMAYPVITVAMLWLAYGNFRWVFESRRRWGRNVLGLIAVVALISVSAAALYHRAWERFMPLEGAHGAVRLPAGKPVLIRGLNYREMAIVLPDGKLWEDLIDRKDLSLRRDKDYFVAGTNWMDIAPNHSETVAIQSDGTLWVSAQPLQWPFFADAPSQMIRFGAESNWQGLVRDSIWSVILLKQDGTLWRWGTNYETSNAKNYQNPGLRSMKPQRLGADSDWTRILAGWGPVYAWKRDGQAWMVHKAEEGAVPVQNGLITELAPGTMAERVRDLDNIQFKSLNTCPIARPYEIGVREDGTLWYWDWSGKSAPSYWNWGGKSATLPPNFLLLQIGHDSNWVAVASAYFQLTALKTDGSIWTWNLQPDQVAFRSPPVQMGTNGDWVGLGNAQFKTVTLAADGVLWSWPTFDDLYPRRQRDSDLWLAPSRRPQKIKNIYEARE